MHQILVKVIQKNADIQGNITRSARQVQRRVRGNSDILEVIVKNTAKETGCSVGIILEALFNVLKDEYVIGETDERH